MIGTLVVITVIAGFFVGSYFIRSNYYVAERDGSVYIMRGFQGSVLGIPLQEPHRLGCLDSRGGLKIIGAEDSLDDCAPLQVADLRESERTQVTDGLPAGSENDAVAQLMRLGDALLPPCVITPSIQSTTPRVAPPPPPGPSESPTLMPTVTALPPTPQEPGVNCRAAP